MNKFKGEFNMLPWIVFWEGRLGFEFICSRVIVWRECIVESREEILCFEECIIIVYSENGIYAAEILDCYCYYYFTVAAAPTLTNEPVVVPFKRIEGSGWVDPRMLGCSEIAEDIPMMPFEVPRWVGVSYAVLRIVATLPSNMYKKQWCFCLRCEHVFAM